MGIQLFANRTEESSRGINGKDFAKGSVVCISLSAYQTTGVRVPASFQPSTQRISRTFETISVVNARVIHRTARCGKAKTLVTSNDRRTTAVRPLAIR